MLATIAARLTDQLYFRCPLDPSKKAIYEYGIQLSLSTLASMCSIVLLGLLLKNPASAFIFLGVFFFLRLFSGGYHAPTYARCFLLTNSVYRNRQTSGRKKRPPPQRPGFEMAVRDSIRF